MEIRRTALVAHSAADMFRLVEDVERYPQFLSWCQSAQLVERTEFMQLATLEVAIVGIRQKFTTRNRLTPGEQLSMSLVEGPFRRLSGDWRFQPLDDSGCKVSLELAFEFSGSLFSGAFRRGFSNVADRMVAEFCRRADDVYGRLPGVAG